MYIVVMTSFMRNSRAVDFDHYNFSRPIIPPKPHSRQLIQWQ